MNFSKILRLILLLLNLIFLFKILSVTSFFAPSRNQPDFDIYYRTVSDMRKGINPYTVSYMQTFGPPLVFLYYIPFSLFSLYSAQSLNLLINLISGYLACYLLGRKFKINFLILTIIFYGSFLSRYSLQIGQPHLFITLLITLAIMTPKFRRLFLTALFIVKAFFIFPLLVVSPSHKLGEACLPARQGLGVRYLKNFLGVFLVFLLSFLFIRPSWYFTYLNRFPALKFTQITETLKDNEYYNQSLRSTMKRLNISTYYPYIYFALIAFAIVLILTTNNLPLSILFSFLITPVLWQHYFIALFPIFVKTFFSLKNPKSYLLLLTSFILWWPDLRLHEAPVTILNRLLASHFYFSLILLTLVQFIPKITASVSPLPQPSRARS